MNVEELKELLKEKLTIKATASNNHWGPPDVTVKIYFDNEEICRTEDN